MSFDVCARGAGQLRVELVSGQSAATSVRAVSPLRILTPRLRGPSVWACLGSLGGGLVAGDEMSLSIKVGKGARAFVSTQASTKVYRNPAALPCGHVLRAEIDEEALLVLSPDPVQAFAGASYRQRQEFQLAPDGGLVLVDWLGAGRAARGERWAFRRIHSHNGIVLGQKRVLLDSLFLEGGEVLLEPPGRLGRFNCLALVVVLGGLLGEASAALLQEIARRPVTARPTLVCGASPIAGGALVRLAGENPEAVASEVRRWLSFVPAMLGDDPWARKW